jgi:MinD-like ATPase involved in chromosome partitioning or flagellar assembly
MNPFGGLGNPYPFAVPERGYPRTSTAVHTIAVGGGMLGVGASTVSALLALALADDGKQVLLVQGDGDAESLARLLGLRSSGAEPGMMRIHPALTLWLPGRDIAGGARTALYARFDAVVVDAGWRLDALLDACAGGVERVLLVSTAGRASLSATFGLMKGVETRFPTTRFEVVMNQQELGLAQRGFEHLQTAAFHFLGRAIGFAGAVPDDACLRAGTAGGMTAEDAAAESAVAAVLQQIALRILAEHECVRALPSRLLYLSHET